MLGLDEFGEVVLCVSGCCWRVVAIGIGDPESRVSGAKEDAVDIGIHADGLGHEFARGVGVVEFPKPSFTRRVSSL